MKASNDPDTKISFADFIHKKYNKNLTNDVMCLDVLCPCKGICSRSY